MQSVFSFFHSRFGSISGYRLRLIFAIIVGYAAYYTLRVNFSFALPYIAKEFSYSKTELGMLMSLFSLVYGVGKFFAGVLGDNISPRILICMGLFVSGIANILIPSAGTIFAMSVLLTINALSQSTGWPPCVKLLNKVFDRSEIGGVWGLCNSAHAIGSGLVALIAPILIIKMSWSFVFYAPAILSFLLLGFLFFFLRPPLANEKASFSIKKHEDPSYREYLFSEVFRNPIVWLMCLTNVSLYMTRVGFLYWLPTYLLEYKEVSIAKAGTQLLVFEFLGILGGIVAGYLSDSIHGSRRASIGCLFVLGSFSLLLLTMSFEKNQEVLFFICFSAIGFFIYGTQVLVGLIANDHVHVNVSGCTTGLVGTFGYLGSAISGVGLGFLADNYGWEGAFAVLAGCSAFCLACFISVRIILITRKSFQPKPIFNQTTIQRRF